jgi:hypothetical protein
MKISTVQQYASNPGRPLSPKLPRGRGGPGISVTKEDEDTSQIQNKSPQKAKKNTNREEASSNPCKKQQQ